MNKVTVLFVDDEPNVLQGLRRMLRQMRDEWDMHFAEGGQAALDAMAQTPFDILVTDMRMPGINGAELLTHVKMYYPQMVRIILSGQSSKATTLRSVGLAHQFLSKPCDPTILKEAVVRSRHLRTLLSSEPLRARLAEIDSLPSPPRVYQELLQELQHLDPSVKRIGAVIARDPAMTAKLLQMVNSSFFGISSSVSSPERAVTLLGIETIKQLVLVVHIFSQMKLQEASVLGTDQLWKHCLLTGVLAREIAARQGADDTLREDAMAAGLLHDVGKLVLARYFPDDYRSARSVAESDRIPEWQAERSVIGASHAEVGGYLLSLWGLPDCIVEAAAFHHEPSHSKCTTFSPLVATHVADALLYERDHEEDGNLKPSVDEAFLARIGLATHLPAWRARCAELIEAGDADVMQDTVCG